MKFKTLAIAAFAATTTFAIPASASTMNLVTNGSFEVDPGNAQLGLNGGTFSSLAASGGRNWDIFTSLPGWYSDFGAGIEIQTGTTLGLSPQDDDHFVELDSNNNSSMLQDLTLAAGSYKLSFWFSPRQTNAATNTIDFGVFDANQSSSLFGTVTGPDATYQVGEWTQVVAGFDIAVAGDYTLFFDAAGVSDSYGGLVDNVSLTAVPLPATGLMLLAGLGGLAGLRRRRKTA